jgi:hypothetical protein
MVAVGVAVGVGVMVGVGLGVGLGLGVGVAVGRGIQRSRSAILCPSRISGTKLKMSVVVQAVVLTVNKRAGP